MPLLVILKKILVVVTQLKMLVTPPMPVADAMLVVVYSLAEATGDTTLS